MSHVKIHPYLYLPGNSEKAMNSYKEIFGGEIVSVQRYGDKPDIPCADEDKDKLLHGHLKIGDQAIYFSDMVGNHTVTFGNQVSLTLEFTEEEMIEKAYHALSEGGKVLMPLQNTFWGAKYGKVTDQFGVNWDLNCQL
ncbi:VOC family protein [Paenactinomyces guangxiensis]|uniref:VOC family protein n=1 Tax=Paenactinomyces guangxiensis TaxID=1490290 RepID=A0A7W1WN57_9BACL|nr:VOC family protein [Paenactinomyces guangxiensis]MBA4492954.1 VOC family protein [Paenactinomyces guangxiensis]MBH8590197.1 VOC family protein [Paenactinomyces guangxiensis]